MTHQQSPGHHATGTGRDEFFSPRRRKQVFDPAAQFRTSAAAQHESPEVLRKRRRARRRTINRVVATSLLLCLGLAGWLGYPPVSARVKTFVLESMVQEMGDVVTAQQNYHSLYGSYTTDRSQLTAAEDGFNNVRIVSADGRGFCLAGDSLLGQKRYYTPASGITETACV